jgi:DNA-binding NarL/FixJ family response regulator
MLRRNGVCPVPARVLIADDHEVVRFGIRCYLARNPEIEVCGEALNGRMAIEQVRQLKPDAVILDISMPEVNGYDAAQKIRTIAPSTRIVVYSIHHVPVSARNIGVDAFLSKTDPLEELLATLERLLELPNAKPKD